MSVLEHYGVPPEATGEVCITLCGKRARVEGRCRVLEYGDAALLLKCRKLYIRFKGSGLEISAMDKNETLINGEVFSVSLSERREK